MKKQLVNCETGITEIVDIDAEEESKLLEASSLVSLKDPPPPTIEDRISALETELEKLKV